MLRMSSVDFLLLFSGVDTLECTFAGQIHPDLLDALHTAKLKAQGTNRPIPFEVGEETLYVQPKGQGFYSIVLADSRMRVLINAASSGPPPVLIRLRASALATYGCRALYDQACTLASALGELCENTLSRIDLFADLQDFEFTDTDFANLVCAASYRAKHKDGEGLTYQIGKGDVVMRVYRKDIELRDKNHEGYREAWKPTLGYDPDAPVFRIEVQLRGNVLRELGVRSVRTALDKLDELFTFGLKWCELRVLTGDETKLRWPVDRRWEIVRAMWHNATPAMRVRTKSKTLSEDRTLSRLLGGVATIGAYSGKRDLVEALIVIQNGLEWLMREREVEFSDLVDQRIARLVSEEGLSL